MPRSSITNLKFHVDADPLLREQFRQDALIDWTRHSTIGFHANAEEVDAWLAKLEEGEDAAPPKCHV